MERIVITNILDAAFVEELVDVYQHFWEAGWGEHHAGNISYLLSDDEPDQLKEYTQVSASIDVAFDTAGLKGKAFIVAKSGACFRTMKKKYEWDLGIIQFKENGYDTLWGLDQGRGRPISEPPAYVLCHRVGLADDANNKIVMYCHSTYLNVAIMIHELDEESFTQTLWKMNSECALVFSEGPAVLPWMKCGKGPISPATADKMKDKRVVIWPSHGIFSSGNFISDAIGSTGAIDENVHVHALAKVNMIHGMTDENVRELKEHFGLS